jgi:hypothetical protein
MESVIGFHCKLNLAYYPFDVQGNVFANIYCHFLLRVVCMVVVRGRKLAYRIFFEIIKLKVKDEEKAQ